MMMEKYDDMISQTPKKNNVKSKTTFFLPKLYAQYAKWQGQCNFVKNGTPTVEIQKQESSLKSEPTSGNKAPKPSYE
jgi:hypothetical protein